MYCKNCGAQNDDNASNCSQCGTSLTTPPPPYPGPDTSQDELGVPLSIVSFCFPIVGAVLYFVYKDKQPRKSRQACNLALIGLAVGIVLNIIVRVMAPNR